MSKYPAESQYRNKLCRACRSGMYISRNEYSCCPGLDHTAVKSSHNDLTASEDVLEHYRYIITDALGGLPHLASLNLGSLATNNISWKMMTPFRPESDRDENVFSRWGTSVAVSMMTRILQFM